MKFEDLITAGLAVLLIWLLLKRQEEATPKEEVTSTIKYEGF
jgi:hypothetical protein